MAELENPEVMRRVISLVSSILERVSETNDVNGSFRPQRISVFHGLIRPSISIESYLERIFTYAKCSPSCLIVAYIYLDRFSEKQPFFPISSFNVHRLIITSVMVSAKFMDDLFYNNAFYAKVGGISTMEMNMLEMDFLFGLGFQLNVTPTTFYSYCREILFQHPPLLPSTSSSIHNHLGPDQDLHFRTTDDESAHRQQHLVV